MIYILIGLFVFGLITYLFFKKKKRPVTGNYFISTQAESEERLKEIDLGNPSENASYILDTNRLSFPIISEEIEDVEYKPDPTQDWIIEIKTLKTTLYTTDQLSKIFDNDWHVNFTAATIYGYLAKEKKWTYPNSGGAPEIF